MTLEEAIVVDTDIRAYHLLRKDYKASAGLTLGIEAMKHIIELRQSGTYFKISPLPGETED